MIPAAHLARRVATPGVLGVVLALVLACRHEPRVAAATRPAGPTAFCTLEDWPSVIAELRDPAGRAVARGATLEIRAERYRSRTPPTEAFDSLRLGAGHRSAGTFTVRASKPGYLAAETTGVQVPGGPCGAVTQVVVPLTLRPARGAPAVRSVVIFGTGVGLGPGIYSTDLSAYVNAADGVDTTLVWRSSDSRVVTVDQRGMITSRCLTRRAKATVTATSRADRRKSASIPVEVWGDPEVCKQRPRGGS